MNQGIPNFCSVSKRVIMVDQVLFMEILSGLTALFYFFLVLLCVYYLGKSHLGQAFNLIR